jgi:hypothetical protein
MSEEKERDMKTYGQLAYEAYFAASDGKSLVSGAQLPAWAEQDEPIQAAWNHGGTAVADDVFADLRSGVLGPEAQPDYRALLDKATAAHHDVGLPGEQAIANAHRREAGLEEL